MKAPLLALLTAAVAVPGASAGAAPPPPGEANRARDGDIAIRQELCAVRKAATIEAYDLFIARHPDHPLAEIARAERRKLLSKSPE